MSEDVEPRGSSTEYREREREMRAAADATDLPGAKSKYLGAAERWRQLAELAENPPTLRRNPPADEETT